MRDTTKPTAIAAAKHYEAMVFEAENEKLRQRVQELEALAAQPSREFLQQSAELTDAQIRAGFQAEHERWTFEGMTALNIWRKACQWVALQAAPPAPAGVAAPAGPALAVEALDSAFQHLHWGNTSDAMKSVIQARAALAAAPAQAPKATGTAHLPYFSYDEDAGVQFWATQERAIKECQDAVDAYREDVEDGWPDDVESVRWGVVLGRAVKTDERPDGSCDYALTPYAAPAQEHATQLAGHGLDFIGIAETWEQSADDTEACKSERSQPDYAEGLVAGMRQCAADLRAAAAPIQAQEDARDAARWRHFSARGVFPKNVWNNGNGHWQYGEIRALTAEGVADAAIAAARAAQGGAA